MTVIEMPTISSARADASNAIDRLGTDLSGAEITIRFPENAMVTPSVLGQILFSLLLEHNAAMVRFAGGSDYINGIVADIALDYDVTERVAYA